MVIPVRYYHFQGAFLSNAVRRASLPLRNLHFPRLEVPLMGFAKVEKERSGEEGRSGEGDRGLS